MERKTTREHYIESVHEVIAVNAAWMKTEPDTEERAAAYLAYEQAMGFAQIRASRLGYHEHQLFSDAMVIRDGGHVS